MKTTVTKLIAALLALLVCAGSFCALSGCADTGTPDDSTAGTSSAVADVTTDNTPEDTTPTALSVLGERDFGGETVTFYSRYYNGVWKSDLMATEDDFDTLKIAVYRRNKFIEETYKVTIAEKQSGAATFKSALEKLVTAGDNSFDAVYMSVTDAADSAQAGLLWDLHDIERIDLEGQWW